MFTASINSLNKPPVKPDKILVEPIGAPSTTRKTDTVEKAAIKPVDEAFVLDQPKLALPQNKGTGGQKEYLEELASAFTATFEALANGAEFQVEDQRNLMQMDQTMATTVEKDSTETINQERQQVELVQKVQNEEKHESSFNKIFSDVSSLGINWALGEMGIHGISQTIISAVILGTLAVSLMIGTGGAGSAVAAPLLEEDAAVVTADIATQVGGDAIEMVDLGGESTEGGMSEVSESSSASDGSTPANLSDDEEDDANLVRSDDESLNSGAKELGKEELADSSKSEDSDNTVKRKVQKKLWALGKKGASMAIGCVWGIPMILQGVASIKISKCKDDVADAQKKVGAELNTLKVNNGYFKMYQQLLQRGTHIAKEMGNEMSEVVQIFGEVTNAYKQTANLLASQSA